MNVFHDTKRIFKCNDCDTSFVSQYKFQIHSEKHTKKSPVACDICGRIFYRLTPLKRHLQEVHNHQKFSCSQCDSSFAREEKLDKHKQSHTDKDSYQCQYCDRFFLTNSLLQIHLDSHAKNRELQCNECKKTFTSKRGLSVHMRKHYQKSSTKQNIEDPTIIHSSSNVQSCSINKAISHSHTSQLQQRSIIPEAAFNGIQFKNPKYDCYINAALNCLFSSNYLRNKIINADTDNDHVKTLQRIIQGEGVQHIQKELKGINDFFGNDAQHDSQEFLLQLIDIINDNVSDFSCNYDIKCVTSLEC